MTHPSHSNLSHPDSGARALSGAIRSEQGSTLWGLLALTIIWNGFAWGAVWAITSDPEPIETLALVALSLFPLVGLLFLVLTLRSAIRRYKFGESHCQLRSRVMPGEELTGHVYAGGALTPESRFQLHLTCIRYITTGSGKERRLDSRTLWETSWEAKGHRTTSSHQGITIPVEASLPADASPSRTQDPDDQIIWRLTVRAKTDGVDYHASFVIPVLETEALEAGI